MAPCWTESTTRARCAAKMSSESTTAPVRLRPAVGAAEDPSTRPRPPSAAVIGRGMRPGDTRGDDGLDGGSVGGRGARDSPAGRASTSARHPTACRVRRCGWWWTESTVALSDLGGPDDQPSDWSPTNAEMRPVQAGAGTPLGTMTRRRTATVAVHRRRPDRRSVAPPCWPRRGLAGWKSSMTSVPPVRSWRRRDQPAGALPAEGGCGGPRRVRRDAPEAE